MPNYIYNNQRYTPELIQEAADKKGMGFDDFLKQKGIELEPEEAEKAQFEQNIQVALQQGGIGLEDVIDLRQIKNLKLRLNLTRWMQIFGISSLLFCVLTMFLIYVHQIL